MEKDLITLSHLIMLFSNELNKKLHTTMYIRNYGGFDYVRIQSELRASVLNRKIVI